MSRYVDADELIAICNIMATQEYAEIWHQFSALVMWQQTADVEPRWIPVTERLPVYGEDVLLSMNGDYGIGYLVPTYDERRYEWHHSGWFYDFDEVDAWMPLPEPYKGGEGE